jgi:hypothetical protein
MSHCTVWSTHCTATAFVMEANVTKTSSGQKIKACGKVVSGSGRSNSWGKGPPLPTEQNVSASQNQSWRLGDHKALAFTWFEPRFLDGAVRPVVTDLSELHRLFLLEYKQEHCQSNTHSPCAINVHKVPDGSARLSVPVQLQGDTNFTSCNMNRCWKQILYSVASYSHKYTWRFTTDSVN